MPFHASPESIIDRQRRFKEETIKRRQRQQELSLKRGVELDQEVEAEAARRKREAEERWLHLMVKRKDARERFARQKQSNQPAVSISADVGSSSSSSSSSAVGVASRKTRKSAAGGGIKPVSSWSPVREHVREQWRTQDAVRRFDSQVGMPESISPHCNHPTLSSSKPLRAASLFDVHASPTLQVVESTEARSRQEEDTRLNALEWVRGTVCVVRCVCVC